MSQLDTIVTWTKRIESTLEKQLGAEGRGLHEKTSSVGHHLDARLVKLLRRIATIRNKSMHEEDYKVEDINRFIEDCDTAHKRIIAIGNGNQVREVPASAAMSGGFSLSQPAFSYSVSGMKAFFLRELAFLMTPALMITRPKELLSRAIAVVVAVISGAVLINTLMAFVLGPVGWVWLGVVIGFGASVLLLLYLLSIGI